MCKTVSRLKDLCSHYEKVNANFAAAFVLMSDSFDLRKSLESPADVWSISTNKDNFPLLFLCLSNHACSISTVTCFLHYHSKKLMLTHNVDTVWSKVPLVRLYVLYLYCVDHLNLRKWPLMIYLVCEQKEFGGANKCVGLDIGMLRHIQKTQQTHRRGWKT